MKTTQLAKEQKQRREARVRTAYHHADIDASIAAMYALQDVRDRVFYAGVEPTKSTALQDHFLWTPITAWKAGDRFKFNGLDGVPDGFYVVGEDMCILRDSMQ